MSAPRRDPDTQGGDSYQVDVVVSLFAIMLVVLITLTAATAVSENEVTTEYRVQDPPTARIALRSIQVPYRLRELWVLGADGFLGRLDRAASLAAFDRMPAPGTAARTTIGQATDLDLATDGAELGSFQMAWRFADPRDAAPIIAERVDWRDDAALAAWAARPGGVVIFARRDAHDALPRVDQALRAGGRGHDILVLRRALSKMVYQRYRSNFSGETVLRAH